MKALFAAATLLPMTALAGSADQIDYTPDYTQLQQQQHQIESDSELVRAVREATSRYKDFRQVVKDNTEEIKNHPGKPDLWVVGTPCVSGPDHGAMGVHIVKLSRAAPDPKNPAVVDIKSPTALIYEPQIDGHLVLVGLEYIKDAAAWAASNGKSVPSLDGHLMNLVGAPNRYGLGAFFELHVWAFEGNPQGAFVDWNNHVTCEKQPLNFSVSIK